MGIDVQEKNVCFNNTHQDLINTDIATNPTFVVKHGLFVYSVFRRVRHRSLSGDGNPLIYALKRKSGYLISKNEILKFMPAFYAILGKLSKGYPNVGISIVPMPSNHSISFYLARRIQRQIPGAILIPNLLQKKTCGQVYTELCLITPPATQKSEFNRLLAFLSKRTNEEFSLKDVDVKLRHFTQPLQLNQQVQIPNTLILLVDDLMASGTTLLCARNLLAAAATIEHGWVSSICLLSTI